MGVHLTMFSQEDGALHCVLVEEKGKCESDYLNFMFRMFVLRRYRLEVWQRLVPSIPPAGTPAWPDMLRSFAAVFGSEEKVFPHQFRPTTLRGYRDEAGVLKSITGITMAREAREVLTLKLLYRALPRDEILDFVAAAGPCTFGALYDKMKENLNHVLLGVFGDYGIKLMLDMLVLTGGVPQAALSRWPTDCPGYRGALATLFPGLPQGLHLRALYWVHKELGKTWRFQFPESCAQLCWDHRRQKGALDDAMDMDI